MAVGAMIKRITVCMLAAALVFSSAGIVHADVAAVTMRVEQVHAKMPQLSVNFYADQFSEAINAEDITAELGGKKLEVKSLVSPAASPQTFEWYLLVDISGSVGDSGEDIKAALLKFVDKVDNNKKNDNITLITFGDKTEKIYSGSESEPALKEKINNLTFEDNETVLYQAVTEAAILAGQNLDDIDKRNIGIVITDGKNEDFKGTNADALRAAEKLRAASMPLYAFAIDGSGSGEMSELVKLTKTGPSNIAKNAALGGKSESGGKFYEVTARNLGTKLAEFADYMLTGYVLSLESESNKASNDIQDLTVTIRTGELTLGATVGVIPSASVPDNVKPEVSAVEQLKTKNGIRIHFNKTLDAESAQKKESYTIKSKKNGDVSEKIKKIIYSPDTDKDGNRVSTVEILFSEELYSGDYAVSFSGITDNAAEQNPLTGEKKFAYKGRSEVAHVSDVVFGKFWWALALLILIVLALVIILYIRKRGGLVRVDGKIGFGDLTEFKYRMETPDSGAITLVVTDTAGQSQSFDININKSFFVGRSNINNLSFPDDKLSRQHFVIEVDGGAYFITDLNTTNGTFVNGVPLTPTMRRNLGSNDVITAGREKIVFRVKQPKGGQ